MNQRTDNLFLFETGMYRPPSEGGSYSLLLRLTRNCPWNRCTFCGMYKDHKFSLRSVEEIKADIDAIASICRQVAAISHDLGFEGRITRRVISTLISTNPALGSHHGFVMVLDWLMSGGRTAFLQDANSLIMKTQNLVLVLEYLRRTFPMLERVTSYARSKTLARKPLDELQAIRKAGLDRLHVGLETGDEELLRQVKKGVTPEEHIEGGRKAMEAGFQLSEYWMPGLGGKANWENHARNTALVLNRINPHYIRSRPFYPAPGTPLFEEHSKGKRRALSPREQLLELRAMISELDVSSRVCFDHAGNHWRNAKGGLLFTLDYEGYSFPEQKRLVLDLIEEGIRIH
ncbi:MAG: radical SAM protein [Deltaproteobacteria bacterium]|nr:radical SAM protein [Deltaproteobacteria bacterium]MBW1924347.1 radical SAM protein [Deltaproteobacteria bacterium]MBW1950608.1 radical SAM protein [Deltaproteobacteria bacterium]MBW2009562.1 radical SAM protein [Deltaproteobacteria bacterium]MBW2348582.1 radical SAM protein [Deltaproteobacteria bacterium]